MARLTLEQIWINATTLPDAKGNPAVWRRNYSQSPKRQINQIVPFLGTKTVLISASFWGLTEKSVHLSNSLFMGCEIIEEIDGKKFIQSENNLNGKSIFSYRIDEESLDKDKFEKIIYDVWNRIKI